MSGWIFTFILSFALCAYIYAGYPLLMWMLSRLREQRIAREWRRCFEAWGYPA